MTEDVGAVVEKERRTLQLKTPVAQGDFSYDTYPSLQVMYDHLDALVTKHETKAEVLDLGETYEKRQIRAIRMTNNIALPESEEKPLIWIDGCIHAREWVVPVTMMYFVDALLGEQEKDKAIQMDELLDEYQIVVAPCINPDGYEYSREEDRFWRKNRKPSGCKHNKANWYGGCFIKWCHGVDLNRNWDGEEFATVGISKDPCSNIYPGKEPFDQEDSRVIRDYLEPKKDKLKLFLTYHSYSQLFLFPLGYTEELPPEHEHHARVGKAVVEAIAKRHGVEYIAKPAALLYPVSGDSIDWAYTILGVIDSYTFELRPDADSWRIGFELPAEQILPTAQENVDGLLALIANTKYEMEKKSSDPK